MKENGSETDIGEAPTSVRKPCGPLLDLDVDSIVMGRWENRLTDAYDAPEFAELKKAIELARGNTQPVTVQVMRGGSSPPAGLGQFELLAGHRRVRACRELGLPVRAMVLPPLDERDLFQFVYQENSSRDELRPYELGRMCALALANGIYPSLRKLCAMTALDVASASRAVRLYEMPQALHDLIRSPRQWQLKDADKLGNLVHAEGFEAKVEVLRRVHGVMDRVPLLRALAGVGSTNIESVLEIFDDDAVVGRIFLSREGKVRVVLLHPLVHEQAEDLRRLLQAWLAKSRRA
jgi:ParB/RepB/Spo0J family partition protein